MTLNLFDQFMSPTLLGLPLLLLALGLPLALLSPQTRLIASRTATIQSWLMLMFSRHLMSPLNKPGHAWTLPLLTLMYFLLITNLLGLLPYTFTPTTQLSLNMAIATPLWLMTVLTGFRSHPSAALAHFLPPGTPMPLAPALVLIETISLFIRPVALGVRLTANLTAGHLLISLISITAFALFPITPTGTCLTLLLLLLLSLLEIAVAMIQAYVFTLLLSLYLQENT